MPSNMEKIYMYLFTCLEKVIGGDDGLHMWMLAALVQFCACAW